MTSLYFMPVLNRIGSPNVTYKSRYFFKNSLYPFRNTADRVNVKQPKVCFSNTSIKSVSICKSNLFSGSNQILISVCLKQPLVTLRHRRYFHTSDRRYLHPIFWTVLRPALKFLAIITGRAFRKWWRELPPNKRKYFLQVLKENRHKIAIFIMACVSSVVIYYVSHLEEAPITKRRRFMAFNPKQLKMMNQFEFQQIMQKMQHQILPAYHPSTLRVKAIVSRVLEANKDIEEIKGKKWGVSVINSSVENAFVLPIGHVFVFTGMLSLCTNDDELAIIISHEIAHCLQNHGAENVSFTHLLDLISIAIIAVIWAVIPSDSLSLLTHWLYHKCMEIFLTLPYNRNIEMEADAVGLNLAAKACFDVRESTAFWAKMAYLNEIMEKGTTIEFLSTHPSHEKRSEYLDSLMDEAIKLRSECGCPRLKPTDPRLNVQIMAKALDAARRKYLHQYPKPAITIYI